MHYCVAVAVQLLLLLLLWWLSIRKTVKISCEMIPTSSALNEVSDIEDNIADMDSISPSTIRSASAHNIVIGRADNVTNSNGKNSAKPFVNGDGNRSTRNRLNANPKYNDDNNSDHSSSSFEDDICILNPISAPDE